MKQVSITPIFWRKTYSNVDNLLIEVTNDNLVDSAIIYWQAMAGNTFVDDGNITASGTDYTNWTQNHNYPVTFILNFFQLTAAS